MKLQKVFAIFNTSKGKLGIGIIVLITGILEFVEMEFEENINMKLELTMEL